MNSQRYQLDCGERVFVDRDVRQNLCGIDFHCDSLRVMRAGAACQARDFEAYDIKICDIKICDFQG